MKTKLPFTKHSISPYYAVLAFLLCFNFASGQNLMLNPTCDDHTSSTGDNADAYDMTPNNTILDESMPAVAVPSPYQAVWDNDALEDWLEIFYLGAAGSLDEQPGSTGAGNGGTRGVKLYDDGNPVITGSSRRIYQKVEGLTIGSDYNFTVESRDEAAGTPSEIYILNTEITDEVGINANGGSDASVDGFLTTSNTVGEWTVNTINFTATNTFAVVYIRSLNSIDTATEVFYDNFSLMESTLSTKDFSSSSFALFPNPAKDMITIKSSTSEEISSVQVFDLLGKEVLNSKLVEDNVNLSTLSKGVYMLKINSISGKTATKKIIKE